MSKRRSKKHVLGFLAMFVVTVMMAAFMVTNTFAQECPSGLVSYWKFDEVTGSVAHDSISGNDGTLNGGNWSTGQVGGALSFDGVDDMVVVPHSSSLSLDKFTLAAWVKKYPNPNVTVGGVEFILVKRYQTWSFLSFQFIQIQKIVGNRRQYFCGSGAERFYQGRGGYRFHRQLHN